MGERLNIFKAMAIYNLRRYSVKTLYIGILAL
jgi:hypothetical protein